MNTRENGWQFNFAENEPDDEVQPLEYYLGFKFCQFCRGVLGQWSGQRIIRLEFTL